MGSEPGVYNPLASPILFLYQLFQWLIDKIISPTPPTPSTRLGRPKVAVIGAGLTGVTAAAHCIGHGFDVVIFEAGSKENAVTRSCCRDRICSARPGTAFSGS